MEAYVQTTIGILVSIALFLLGYRQTIGARKERVRLANASIHRALLRRMVLEDYHPEYQDVSRLVEGKAREFRVKVADLLSEEQILNAVFTDVFDNDLIAPSQRVELEGRLKTVFHRLEQVPNSIEVASVEERSVFAERTQRYVVLLAVTTSSVGAATTLLPQVIRGQFIDQQLLLPVIVAFVVSLTLITTIVSVRRTRESLEDNPFSAAFEGAPFEQEAASALENHNIPYSTQVRAQNRIADFVAESNGKRIVLEAKAWRGPVSSKILAATASQVMATIQDVGADKGVIVTRDRHSLPKGLSMVSGVPIVPLRGLAAYLRNAA